jgi:Zn/Cd-binding protein ZinT
MIEAGFKYFLLFPFHQHNKDSLRHCHLRYGNENFDFLVTDPSVQLWWPTVYQPENTDEAKIMAQMTKKAKLQATMLPPLKNQ